MTAQHLTPRQARWASLLSMYHFEILHTPGKLNPADPASQRPDFVSGKHTDDKVVLLGFRSLKEEDSEICALSPIPEPSLLCRSTSSPSTAFKSYMTLTFLSLQVPRAFFVWKVIFGGGEIEYMSLSLFETSSLANSMATLLAVIGVFFVPWLC